MTLECQKCAKHAYCFNYSSCRLPESAQNTANLPVPDHQNVITWKDKTSKQTKYTTLKMLTSLLAHKLADPQARGLTRLPALLLASPPIHLYTGAE